MNDEVELVAPLCPVCERPVESLQTLQRGGHELVMHRGDNGTCGAVIGVTRR